MNSFADLVASRRDWLEQVLKPWCRSARLANLKRAELEWEDIAGKVDPQSTLWTWAWSRFPEIVHEGLAGVNETNAVRVTLRNGQIYTGYPDNRKSASGRLFMLSTEPVAPGRASELGPISIDDIARIERV